MIEIKMWADIHSTGLSNNIGKYIVYEETSISIEAWQELQSWVERYDDIAVMNKEQRILNSKRIITLDNEGLLLMKRISNEWPKDLKTGRVIKFIYYSEGFLKILDNIIPNIAESLFEEE